MANYEYLRIARLSDDDLVREMTVEPVLVHETTVGELN